MISGHSRAGDYPVHRMVGLLFTAAGTAHRGIERACKVNALDICRVRRGKTWKRRGLYLASKGRSTPTDSGKRPKENNSGEQGQPGKPGGTALPPRRCPCHNQSIQQPRFPRITRIFLSGKSLYFVVIYVKPSTELPAITKEMNPMNTEGTEVN